MGYLRAVLFDLGDVIMQEATEVKNTEGVTLSAALVNGITDCMTRLRERGIPLAIVADTLTGTCTNVLNQHGLASLFPVRAISEQLGVRKPHPLMFRHALEALGIPENDWHRVVMVGNNLARDVEGAARLDMTSVWFHWNDRYPSTPENPWQKPDYTVGTAKELTELLIKLDESDKERALVAQAAPKILFDLREPFFPVKVGYSIIQTPQPSPSFRRGVECYVDEERQAERVIEYAIYWDWDIGHLYELEHLWVYVDEANKPLRIDGSWHGTYHVLGVAGRNQPLPKPLTVYSQPGKHAFTRSLSWFEPREQYVAPCVERAGNAGLLIPSLFDGDIGKDEVDDHLVAAFLKQLAFTPSFQFERAFHIDEAMLMPWEQMRRWIPRRITSIQDALRRGAYRYDNGHFGESV